MHDWTINVRDVKRIRQFTVDKVKIQKNWELTIEIPVKDSSVITKLNNG